MAQPQIQYETVDRATMEAASAIPDGPTLVRSTGVTTPAADTPPDSLSALHVDMHVYSPQREGRFVLINMKKYLEGQTLLEGPLVEQITANGVVLSYQNKRWELDRP
jgi:general secretion pathway protein B